MAAEGDYVAMWNTATATHRGDHFGMPASGKRINMKDFHFFRFSNGKIVEHWNQVGFFWDPTGDRRMKRVMVRYKTKPDRAGENQQYIEKVFQELRENGPEGLRYASFKLSDGVTFVHVASIETADGNNPLAQSAAFRSFQAGIKDRCEEQPVATDLTEIGSYRLFG
jgi:SnoaL-like polyketide cyclase